MRPAIRMVFNKGYDAHLASVGIGVEAVIADHDLSFVRNMGGYKSDKLQIIYPLFPG